MRHFNIKYLMYVMLVALFICCTNMNKTGENSTPEGTVVNDRSNSDMDNQRVSADVDTIASPGSNSSNIKSGDYNERDEQKQIAPDHAETHKGADKTK